jgi:preprotein translocase subunit YajC
VLDTTLITILKTIALAQPEGGGGGGGTSSGPGMQPLLFMMIAMFAVMYFLTIRPQQKREKERREMLAALSKGDRVITNGGILGTIIGLNDRSVVLRVSDDPVVKLEFVRAAVSKVEKEADDDGGDTKS